MKDIEVNYIVGDENKKLQISFTSQGTGQITMDKYYHGQVVFSQNQWRVYLADKSELNNTDDIQALIEILNSTQKFSKLD